MECQEICEPRLKFKYLLNKFALEKPPLTMSAIGANHPVVLLLHRLRTPIITGLGIIRQ